MLLLLLLLYLNSPPHPPALCPLQCVEKHSDYVGGELAPGLQQAYELQRRLCEHAGRPYGKGELQQLQQQPKCNNYGNNYDATANHLIALRSGSIR